MQFYMVKQKVTGKFLSNDIFLNDGSPKFIDESSDDIALFHPDRVRDTKSRDSIWGRIRWYIKQMIWSDFVGVTSLEDLDTKHAGYIPEDMCEYYLIELYRYNLNQGKIITYKSVVAHNDPRYGKINFNVPMLPYDCINELVYLIARDLEVIKVDLFDKTINWSFDVCDCLSKKAKAVYDELDNQGCCTKNACVSWV